jgi:hypothetical protein
MTNEELQLRDQAWRKATQESTRGWHELLSSFESIYTELLYDHWKKLHQIPDTKVITNPPLYKYDSFEDYWKVLVQHLWNIKEWDNETIKDLIQDVFEDARKFTKSF